MCKYFLGLGTFFSEKGERGSWKNRRRLRRVIGRGRGRGRGRGGIKVSKGRGGGKERGTEAGQGVVKGSHVRMFNVVL